MQSNNFGVDFFVSNPRNNGQKTKSMSKKKEEKLSSLVGVQGFEHVQQFLSGLPKIGKERAIESGLKAGGKLLKEGGKRR